MNPTLRRVLMVAYGIVAIVAAVLTVLAVQNDRWGWCVFDGLLFAWCVFLTHVYSKDRVA